MQKPVWRLNTGKGVPSDYNGLAYIPNGSNKMDSFSGNWKYGGLWSLSEDYPHREDIYAYETNRTKPAKYR